ncbi:MAG: hypothetical protein IT357_00930 [Gemmatimonadaceae bacterium]|nr:hypothetical protein [Gemmatimonadaceae bacterium]
MPEVVALKSIRLPGEALASCTAWPGAVTLKGVGFLRPESAVWDQQSGFWYVSNQGAQANATDGFISKISKDGALVQLNWVAGLGNPTGMRILDGKLFVADPLLHATQPNYAIVMIDIATGTVRRTYTLDLSLMNNPNRGLNDLAIDKATNALYASVFDTRPGFGETIIKVPLDGDGSTATQFVVPGSVGIRPNGVLIHKRDLIVMSGSGLFSRVGLDTRVVEALGSTSFIDPTSGTPILDGIEWDGNAFLFTSHGLASGEPNYVDYLARALFVKNGARYDRKEEQLCTLTDPSATYAPQGAADLGFDSARRMVAIPHLFGNAITFLTLSR